MPTQYSSAQFSSKSIGDAPEAIGVYGKNGVDSGRPYLLTKDVKEQEYSPEAILRFVDNFNDIYKGLHERQDNDRKQYELEDFELDIYSENVTYNEPRYMADSIIQLCANSILNLTVNDEGEDKDKETIIEQFHLSMDKSSDEWLCQMLLGKKKPSLCFHGAVDGWMALRITIYRDASGLLVPCIMPLDPRYLAWSVGMGGFQKVGYTTFRTADEIWSDYKYDCGADVGKITDFWTGKKNIILINDRQVSENSHNISYPPFVIFPCMNQPRIVGKDMSDAKQHLKGWGESVYAANRKMWPVLNKVLSIMLSEVIKAYKKGGVYTTDDDNFNLESLPYAAGQAIKAPSDFKWAPEESKDVAKVAESLFNIFSSAAQRGGVPWLNLGQLWKGQELSGNAIEEMKEGLAKVITPILQTLEMVYQRTSRMVEEQFMSYGQTWEASGYDTKGKHFFRAIEPEDISGNHEIKYAFLSITPQEEARNIAKAQMMKQSGLADDEFIDEEIMKFQDPSGIEDRKLMQAARGVSWKIQYLEMIKAYRKRGNDLYADILAGEFEQRLVVEKMQLAAPQQQLGQQPQTQTALPQGFKIPSIKEETREQRSLPSP